VTGDTYSHVMVDEAEVDYAGLLGGVWTEVVWNPTTGCSKVSADRRVGCPGGSA
jgi:hypothetical protein